ncbi:MAG: hypothetical protein FWC26_01265, partial [Fibromonadales bacterium]|nr:hypothetical protein [Fibromonadales bacterium]
PDSSGYGLFGYISYGKVTNLGVVASYVKGNEKVGGLVGFNNSGTISNCYAVGNVFGNNHVGSLIGAHGGIMVNNYAVGNRGLVGYFYDHYLKRIFSSYYDSDIDESYSIYGTSLTTAEMQSEDFVEKLNLIASSFSGKKWIYTSGEYPKLSGETITVVKYFSGGDGTEKNPYLIKTAEQLRYFSEFVNNGIAFSGEHIKLGDDIDLEGNDSNQWTPIGEDDDFPFRGTFDGDGHVISRVYINNSNENLGLFGAINNQEGEGIVKNLGVEASFVKGSNSIGLLVGYSNGTILNSYAKGIVEGKNNIGGLVGLNGKEVFNSYAIADVKGTSDIGGLVGKNSSDATINNSYFIEKEGGVKIGSLVGEYSGNILNNHYYEDVSDIDSKLADSLNSIAEFIIDAKAWKHNPGSYPTFSDSITGRIEKHFASGSGTESDPFIIINKTQLDTLSLLVSYGQTFQGKYIMLGNDINLKDDDWTPIGTDYYQFKGTFDGNGHVISGLYINEPGSNTLGLFGKLSSAGTIKNLGVTGTVNGHDYIGGLVGISYGKIINSYAKVNVNGYDYVGGLVGFNHQADADCYAIINNSYATGNVKGNDYVGGLVGHSAVSLEKAIINSYATGEVEGEIYVGGLIGFNSFTLISSSYATGKVKGNENVGGLLGQTDGGAIDSSYATGNVSGDSIVGGLVGFNANGNKINSSYAKGKVEGEKNIGGLAGINDTSGVIIDCYAVDSVKGDENIGGLAGQNMGSISNSYAIGNVDGKINFGGLTGLNSKKGFIDESYASWNVPESQEMALGTLVGKNESGGAISNSYGMSLKLMKIKNSFNWNFKSIWSMDPYSNDSLPYLQWQNKMNSAQYGEIETQVYTGSQIIPPKSAVTLNSITLTEGKDFEYKYGENINASPGGIVYIVGLKHEYFGTKIVNFVIKPNKTVRVTWFPECGYSFTYSGSPQSPMPISDYDLEIGEQGTDADSYTIKASLKNPEEDNDVTLENATCGYIIARKELIVEWTDERKFVYNRMTQSPEPTVYDGETKEIPLHINKPKAAGTHTVTAVIIDEKDRENYILRNNTVQFDILKKPLKPYFDTTLANFSTNSGKDTLWVPKGTFADSSAMHNALLGLINYDGFAKDSTGTDDKTAINGIPNVFLQYLLATSHSPLAKRVETTQKATATIITDNVSSDNYALARTNVVIMETVEEEEFVRKVSCMRGNYCTTLDEDVCEFISGKEVSKCDETPIAHTPYPIPHTLIVAKYFTLKGEPLGTI